jgi:hypothetical protein
MSKTPQKSLDEKQKKLELDSVLSPLKKRLGFYSAARELREEILPKILNGSEDDKKAALDRLDNKMNAVLRALESEVHATLMESFDPQLHAWVVEFASKTI